MNKYSQENEGRWYILLGWAIPLTLIFIAVAFPLGVAFFMQSADCGSLQWICDLLEAEEKRTLVRNLGWIAAGTISIAGLVVANRRADAMTGTARAMTENAEASLQAVKATTAGQQQDRFRDAVNHLGHENASVRQGGAHALFHLALEEDKFRASIAEILCAHIRETTRRKAYREDYPAKPSTEIQSLLELLFVEGKREGENEKLDVFWKGISPNLTGCYFQGIELVCALFRKTDLRGAQFQGARLYQAQFQGARLYQAQFHGTRLTRAQFHGALLNQAQFHGARLHQAQFHGARLNQAQFHGALLDQTQFQRARLHQAQFQGARFSKAQFQGAQFSKTQFQGAGALPYEAQSSNDYETQIRSRIECESDLDLVIFSGGLDDTQAKKLVANLKKVLEAIEIDWPSHLPKEDIESFEKEIRENHVGKPKSHTPPEGVITGTYSKEEAGQWIKEYQAALAEGSSNSGKGD